jgi:hypothetical protein
VCPGGRPAQQACLRASMLCFFFLDGVGITRFVRFTKFEKIRKNSKNLILEKRHQLGTEAFSVKLKNEQWNS